MSATSESSVAPLPPSPIRTAGTPFDKPGADIILRTSDLVDFRVYSPVLILASPFFETMFSLPQPRPSSDAQKAADHPPIVEVPEDSATLDALLRICYPIEKPEGARSLAELEAMWKAAVKYEMALPMVVLKKELTDAVTVTPIAVWATACRVGLEALARQAAVQTLNWTPLELTEDALVGVTAADLYRLREFRRLRGQVSADFRLLTPYQTADTTGSASDSSTFTPSSNSFAGQAMPFADLVCRSSDGVDFDVHRGVISSASTMLCQRIQRVLHSSDPAEKPILHLEENSKVVSSLLGLCYPWLNAVPSYPTDSWITVLAAASKYGMEGIIKSVRDRWQQLALRGVNALTLYLVAARMGWKDIAREAAVRTLSDPLPYDSTTPAEYEYAEMLNFPDPAYSHIMESTPANIYLRLIRCHEAYLRAMRDAFRQAGCVGMAKLFNKVIFLSPQEPLFTWNAIHEFHQFYGGSRHTHQLQQLQRAVTGMQERMSTLDFEV